MKKNIFTIVLFLASLASFSQTPHLHGFVKTPDGKPVEFASVTIRQLNKSTYTNGKGFYQFKNIAAGTYTMAVLLIGYGIQEWQVTVTGTETTLPDILLKESSEELPVIEVNGVRSKNGIGNLAESVETVIYSGKKNEVLVLDSLDANKAQNNPREILGRIPGMNFSETEGSGFPSNGFGLRGLNPTQSIEMNTRQNGYNITSDLYGYNEAYYNPAMEAVDRIEITRGAASLQFGPQFGGVVNFVMKQAPKDKVFEYTTQQTGGSFNLFNSFHSVGCTYKKWSYYAYVQYKGTDGWRPNSGYTALTGYGKITYQANSRLKFGLEYSLLRNTIQMPGGLTDAEFSKDSRQSFRTRNWLSSPWNVVTGTVDYKLSPNTSLSLKSTCLFSERNLVWRNEDGGPGVMDTINPATLSYIQREVQRESFSSITNELRVLTNYHWGNMNNTLAAGVRHFSGYMARKGGGPGSTGSDFDMNLYGGDYEYALDFTTTNIAPFFEHIFRITDKWSVTPGFRFEFINSTGKGYITDSIKVFTNLSRDRYIPLFGIGTQYKVTAATNIYANWSQSYRPMDYSSLTPIGVTSKIDPNMKDASGYNADLGWRGTVKNFLNFDASIFYMEYNNRIGILLLTDPVTSQPYTYRTNTGKSVTTGVETYIEINPVKMFNQHSRMGNISIFNSFAYVHAQYVSGTDDNGNSIAGNWVEYAPKTIDRMGITYSIKGFSVTFQYSSTGQSYGDANNTVSSSNAIVGLIPSYQVMDMSATYKIKNFNIKAGVNNVGDARYFTKRTDEYPGPGIIPAIGRSMYVSFGARF